MKGSDQKSGNIFLLARRLSDCLPRTQQACRSSHASLPQHLRRNIGMQYLLRFWPQRVTTCRALSSVPLSAACMPFGVACHDTPCGSCTFAVHTVVASTKNSCPRTLCTQVRCRAAAQKQEARGKDSEHQGVEACRVSLPAPPPRVCLFALGQLLLQCCGCLFHFQHRRLQAAVRGRGFEPCPVLYDFRLLGKRGLDLRRERLDLCIELLESLLVRHFELALIGEVDLDLSKELDLDFGLLREGSQGLHDKRFFEARRDVVNEIVAVERAVLPLLPLYAATRVCKWLERSRSRVDRAWGPGGASICTTEPGRTNILQQSKVARGWGSSRAPRLALSRAPRLALSRAPGDQHLDDRRFAAVYVAGRRHSMSISLLSIS